MFVQRRFRNARKQAKSIVKLLTPFSYNKVIFKNDLTMLQRDCNVGMKRVAFCNARRAEKEAETLSREISSGSCETQSAASEEEVVARLKLKEPAQVQ